MALFRKRAASSAPIYLLMDSNSHVLARGRLKSGSDKRRLSIELLEGDIGDVEDAVVIQAVPQGKSESVQMTRVINCWDDTVTLEPMRDLGTDIRRNFRIPVEFNSFLYPESGGRAPLVSVDLSCGGLAFRSPAALAVGNLFQVVVPLTSPEPLLLNAELLRVHLCVTADNLYACKFIGMIEDEEAMLREAVFAIQLNNIHAKNRKARSLR